MRAMKFFIPEGADSSELIVSIKQVETVLKKIVPGAFLFVHEIKKSGKLYIDTAQGVIHEGPGEIYTIKAFA